jgi:hypothetical protein
MSSKKCIIIDNFEMKLMLVPLSNYKVVRLAEYLNVWRVFLPKTALFFDFK